MSKKKKAEESPESSEFPLAPRYPAKDDIYENARKESLEEDEEEGITAAPLAEEERNLGDDLDIPGAELDDQDEAIGEEDEENNYYSLGGDNHEDLEEDRS